MRNLAVGKQYRNKEAACHILASTLLANHSVDINSVSKHCALPIK